MISKKELTQGNIFKQIILLAMPIIGSSFVQMAYNLTDIFWIGNVGSKYVTAVGTVGYLLWFSVALVFMLKVGAEVLISQSVGSKSNKKIVAIAQNTIFLTVSLAFVLMLLLFLVGNQLLNLFKFADTSIYLLAENYLHISLWGFVFLMLSLVFSGIYNGLGDSKTPFYVNSIGLIINILLDPLLIFGWGFIPELKASGAALASVFSQMVVCLIFIFLLRHKKREILSFIGFKENISKEYISNLIKTGLPVSIHACLFSIFAFLIAQLVSKWGAEPVAILSIGANIEAVSWMTAGGFSTALSTFTGQNYGAGNFKRIKSAFYITSLVSVVFGVLATLAFLLLPQQIIVLFNNEPLIVSIGVDYLKIIAFSQIFMCLEICAAGSFNGMGKTVTPSVVGISLNIVRVLIIFLFFKYTHFGVNVAWWSISLTSVLKGVILVSLLIYFFKNFNRNVY